jgi:hypothetical protein
LTYLGFCCEDKKLLKRLFEVGVKRAYCFSSLSLLWEVLVQRKRIPFQGLGAREWLNLALAAIVVYYLAKPAMEIYFNNTFMFLGQDFLSFWSAGWLANQRGLAAAYEPSQLAEVQYRYIPKPANVEQYQFIPVFTFFLPIFLLPFQLLAMIPITPAFILWTVLNLLGSILYLFFFSRSVSYHLPLRTLLLLILFWPFYQSLFWGQIGLISLVASGEFLRSYLLARYWRAGLWLGILLIKPQTLLLILPFLLLQKQWRVLLGFGLVAAFVCLVSLGLLGIEGLGAYLRLYNNAINRFATVAPNGMLNWRMIGENLSSLGFSRLGWGIAWTGMVVTVLLTFKQFYRLQIRAEEAPQAFLAIFAATALVSWHFHIYSAIVLLPFILNLLIKNKLPDWVLLIWIFLPGLIVFLTDMILLGLKLFQIEQSFSIPALLQGACGFSLAMLTFSWACKAMRSH